MRQQLGKHKTQPKVTKCNDKSKKTITNHKKNTANHTAQRHIKKHNENSLNSSKYYVNVKTNYKTQQKSQNAPPKKSQNTTTLTSARKSSNRESTRVTTTFSPISEKNILFLFFCLWVSVPDVFHHSAGDYLLRLKCLPMLYCDECECWVRWPWKAKKRFYLFTYFLLYLFCTQVLICDGRCVTYRLDEIHQGKIEINN